MPRATLKANQRIKKSQDISTLIRTGQAFFSAPYKVYYQWTPTDKGRVQAAFVVPKRIFARAVMRNRLRRITKECYRLQKQKLESITEENNQLLQIVFIYQKFKVEQFADLLSVMNGILDKVRTTNG